MGTKQTRRRQRLLFYLAGGIIIVLMLNGCATFENYQNRQKAHASMNRAWGLMADGNASQAMAEQEKVLARFPDQPPGDRALYEMGLFFIAPENAHPDFGKSNDCFKRLIRLFPQSRYRQEAAIWSSVLDKTMEFQEQAAKTSQEIQSLKIQLSEQKKHINDLLDQQKKMKQIDFDLNKKREIPSGEGK